MNVISPRRPSVPLVLPGVDASVSERRVALFFGVVTIGYLVFHRSFAYVGLASFGLYIGELTFLVAVLHPSTRHALLGVLRALAEPGPLHILAWVLVAQMGFGVYLVARGASSGYSLPELAKYAVFNFYPLVLVLGLWAAQVVPDILRRGAIALAWANAITGLAFLLVLDRLAIEIPGSQGVRLNIGSGGAFALIALLCFEKNLASRWYLLAANGAVLIGAQGRANWLAFAVGLLMWTLMTRRVRSIVAGAAAGVIALSAIGLLGLQIPTASSRGGSSSLSGVIGRIIATVDPDTAQGLVGDVTSRDVEVTTKWRSEWWSSIWHGVHATVDRALFGYGYGFPLNRLGRNVPDDVRAPHNILMYALAYGGWIGVYVFVAFQGVLAALLWKAWKRTGEPVGIICWAVALTVAVFSNWYEAPFGAFPSYMLIGMALAVLTRPAPPPVYD